MKRIIISILLLLSLEKINAQIVENLSWYDNRYYRYGFTIGVNTSDFILQRNGKAYINKQILADINDVTPGFFAGAIVDIRLAKFFDFRVLPTVSLVNRTVTYSKISPDSKSSEVLGTTNAPSTYFSVPLLIKYKATRHHNKRPYLVAGFSPMFDFSATNVVDENDEEWFTRSKFDVAAQAGVGIDFYLEYFKFSVELKLSVGMLNVYETDYSNVKYKDYMDAVESAHATMVMLSFHFD